MNRLDKLIMWVAIIMLVALAAYTIGDKCSGTYDCRGTSSEW